MLDKKPADDVSISDRIGDRLAEMIATGQLKSGDRLTEATLSDMFACSRVPAREALKVLHAQGILVGGRHRGFRVGEFGPVKTRAVLDVRLALEALLVREAIVHWRNGTSDMALLDRALDDLGQAVAHGDLGEVLRCDLAFHRTIAEAARNDLALTLWNTMARYVIILFNLARYGDVDLGTVLVRHKALRDALLAEVSAPTATRDAFTLLSDHYLASRQPGAPVPLN
ncbi:GntR family transcriptional regulator [Devosia enhydra]|nr:GntR family transcriptional regulator [Devosia enhydra]